MATEEKKVNSGWADQDNVPGIKSELLELNMGPQHPATHGVLRLLLQTDGEIVYKVTPVLGYLHRCAEKIAEGVNYKQWVVYSDRFDYLSPMTCNHAYVTALEKLDTFRGTGSLAGWLEATAVEETRRAKQNVEEPESRQRRLETDAAYVERVTGLAAALDVEIVLNSIGATADGGYANSAYLVTDNGVSPVRYDKVFLVPFGEYLPPWAEAITSEALVREVGRFTPGDEVTPLPALVPLGVAICYEVVFSSHSSAAVGAGAELLVTLTNDGWYGFSWAPVQHFPQVQLRAAEHRRWFARAALTGISGFVDPFVGRSARGRRWRG